MKQTSKRLVSIIFALLFVVVSLVIFFDLIQPEYANVTDLKSKAAGERQFLASASQAATQVQQLISTYKSQSQNVQMLALAMPTGEDLAGALTQIYGIAQSTGVTVGSIGISAPTLQSQTSSTMSGLRPVGTIAFQLAAAGSYEGFKNFLSELENNIRIFDVKAIAIAPGQNATGPTATTQDSFVYTITLVAYYQVP